MPIAKPETKAFPLDAIMAIEPSVLENPKGPGAFLDFLMADPPEQTFTRDGSVAMVTVRGPIGKTAGFFDGYDAIRKRFSAALADPDTGAVLLKLDSPGGTVAGMFDAVRAMRAARAISPKPVLAFADDKAFSAAYALASVADEVFVPETGSVGSIGVVAMLADRTAMNEKMGLRIELVASGKRKVDGNPDVPITDDMLKRSQALVDVLGKKFAASVAETRPLSEDAILGLEADTFMGQAAVKAGLADGILTLEQVTQRAQQSAQELNRKQSGAGAAGGKKMKNVLAALGLLEAATEADAMAAITSIKDQGRLLSDKAKAATDSLQKLEGAIGKTGEEAVGHILGLKAKADQHDKLSAELLELKNTAQQKERDELIAKGIEQKQLTPAMVEQWAKTASLDSLKAFVAVAPKVIPTSDVTEARTAGTVTNAAAAGKKWNEMKPQEKHDLFFSNRALYDALKLEHEKDQAAA